MGAAPHPDGVAELALLLGGRRVVALTGAGISTESGIPDYRGPETRRRAKEPLRFREFIDDPAAQRRYWARSAAGWPRLAAARPNAAHRALAALEAGGALAGVITQNVDGLHQAAGSARVVELHGALARVRCLRCGAAEARAALQERLLALNPGLAAAPDALLPDGDAELRVAESFRAAGCRLCGGALKPDVVFFGESVPAAVRAAADALFAEADALLVVGSSLAVFSGYRFVYHAARRSLPVGVVNLGPLWRGEEAAAVRIDGRAGEILPRLAEALLTGAGPSPGRGG